MGQELDSGFLITEILNKLPDRVLYSGIQLRLERVVELVVFDHKLSGDPEVRSRIEDACSAYVRLNQPNLSRSFDVFYDDKRNHMIIVREKSRGVVLSQMLAGGIDFESFLHIIHQILRALSVAHHHGIVHPKLDFDVITLICVGDDSHFVKIHGFTSFSDFSRPAVAPDFVSNVRSLGAMVIAVLDKGGVEGGIVGSGSGELERLLRDLFESCLGESCRYENATKCLIAFEKLFQVNVQRSFLPLSDNAKKARSQKTAKDNSAVVRTVGWMHLPASTSGAGFGE